MKNNLTSLRLKRRTFLSALFAGLSFCYVNAADAPTTLAHWSFNDDYTIVDGIGTPNSSAVKSNGTADLSSIKLVPNDKNGDGTYYLTAIRPAKDAKNAMQDSKAAYLEYQSISADGAALHITNPLPTPIDASSQFTWNSTTMDFPDGQSHAYQQPYNYFEMELTTAGYKNIMLNIKAAGHKGSSQYYAVMYAIDGKTWTLVSDNNLTGASYNRWTTDTLAIEGLTNQPKAYVRIFPAKNWYSNSSNPFSNNQFDIDDLKLTGELNVPKAEISSINITGQTVTAGADYTYECKLPKAYDGTKVTFTPTFTNSTLACAAVDDAGTAVPVDNNGNGTYSIAVPAPNRYAVVTMTITPSAGSIAPKTTYTMKVFHIGDLSVTALTIDGESMADLVTALNGTNSSATYDAIYTTLPKVDVSMIDGSKATVSSTTTGNNATYAISAGSGENAKNYTLTLTNVHIYTPAATDKTIDLVYTSEGKSSDKWTDGLYTVSGSFDGNNNQCWKFKSGDFVLSLPADIMVKQCVFVNAGDHYNDNAELSAFTSDGATVYVPRKHTFNTKESYNLIINLDNHSAGKDLKFTFANAGQVLPSAIRLIVERVNPQSAPVLKSSNVTSTDNSNHCVVSLNFDREMSNSNATLNGKAITAKGGTSTLQFSLWDLEYGKQYTLTASPGDISDISGNKNTEAITLSLTVGSKPVVEKSAYDYIVSSVSEFNTALNAVNTINTDAAAARKVIFIKNGDYNFGSNQIEIKACNISLVGQSRDGVIIRGNTTGITSHTLSMGTGTGVYLQDLTIRNDFDYGTGSFNGVAVALAGGKKAVLKNVRLLSDQDTYVSNDRTYFEDCEIHGTVDFICGGGNIFFNKCGLILENRGGSCITAPSTGANTQWGYVFDNCTISAVSGAESTVNGTFNLGRPWQNEPRAYYLNTVMNVQPTDNGWGKMSNVITHFYEYHSLDASGNAIDLSKRGNSASSTNKYAPVLTADEAKEFTRRNVLGGSDSWEPTEMTASVSAPMVTISQKTISWTASDDARCYAIFKDGVFQTSQMANSFTIPDEVSSASFTIYSVNAAGGLCGSTVVTYPTDGMTTVTTSAAMNAEKIYHLNGQQVAGSTDKLHLSKGIYVIKGKKFVNR